MVKNVQEAKTEISSQVNVILSQFDLLSEELMRIQHLVNQKIDKMELDTTEQADSLVMRSQEIATLKTLLAQRDNDLLEISTRMHHMVPEHMLREARNESKLLKAKLGDACEEKLIWSNKVMHLEDECKNFRKEKDILCKQMEVIFLDAERSRLCSPIGIRCMNRVHLLNV
jgi:hypothetical protein